jgi:segregation and condensation protein B
MKVRRKRQKRIAPPAPERLAAMLESLLFVADEPLEFGVLARSLGVSRAVAAEAVEGLAGQCADRGIRVQRSGELVQLVTAPEAAPYVERFLEMDHHRLSPAALESLAIVAYRQPVTRAVITSIRGVDSDGVVATLIARGLVEEVGRAKTVGHPALLGTTVRFLEYFGLEKPDDLPPLSEGGEDAEGGEEAPS